MQSRNLEHVYDVFITVTHILGTSFSLPTLIDFMELFRNKPLRIEQDQMPVAMTGYCIALRDSDLICTRNGLDPVLKEVVCLHEIAHLLLGHVPQLSNDSITPDYAAFLLRRDAYSSQKRLRTNHYLSFQEIEAETLATLLFECITRHASSVPNPALDLGW